MISDSELVAMAWEASERAYVPYSGFRVGAALLTAGGAVYTGSNIENVAFSPSNCAERTAFFAAVHAGERVFSAIAVVGESADGAQTPNGYCAPCGVCRQVMIEFCDPARFCVILGSRGGTPRSLLLRELLPESFASFPGDRLE